MAIWLATFKYLCKYVTSLRIVCNVIRRIFHGYIWMGVRPSSWLNNAQTVVFISQLHHAHVRLGQSQSHFLFHAVMDKCQQPFRPDKLDFLFRISHVLDLHAGGW